MGQLVTHFSDDGGSVSICGRDVTYSPSSNLIDEVTCKRCVKRLEKAAEHPVERALNKTSAPSNEQVYLIDLMEDRIKGVQFVCVQEDLSPSNMIKNHLVLKGSILTLGEIIQELYPSVDYIGREFVMKILANEGWRPNS